MLKYNQHALCLKCLQVQLLVKVRRPWHHQKIKIPSNTALQRGIASIQHIEQTVTHRLYHFISAAMPTLRRKNTFCGTIGLQTFARDCTIFLAEFDAKLIHKTTINCKIKEETPGGPSRGQPVRSPYSVPCLLNLLCWLQTTKVEVSWGYCL